MSKLPEIPDDRTRTRASWTDHRDTGTELVVGGLGGANLSRGGERETKAGAGADHLLVTCLCSALAGSPETGSPS